jgi:uncharacterized protein YceK
MRYILLLFVILCLMNGCATMGVTAHTGIPYSGTLYDTVGIIHLTLNPLEWLLKLVFLFDLPFTVVGDTLLLPFIIL